jgi:hypothetical protein
MKLFPSLLSRSVLVAPVLFTSLSPVQAQGVERSIGSHEVAQQDAAPTCLIATLTPADAGSEVKGGISFGHAGDMLRVSGRLDGLDPNKRYRLRVALPDPNLLEAAKSCQNASGDLGILLADASGRGEIRTVLKGVGLVKGDLAVLGKTLILTEIPADGDAGAPVQIASATVQVPGADRDPVQPSRLDELGPGERWF